MSGRPALDTDLVARLYAGEGLSITAIAARLRCSSDRVPHAPETAGIPPRSAPITRQQLVDLYVERNLP